MLPSTLEEIPLLDAIGKTIHKIGNAQKHASEDQRADKAIFSLPQMAWKASHEYTYEKIKNKVQSQK